MMIVDKEFVTTKEIKKLWRDLADEVSDDGTITLSDKQFHSICNAILLKFDIYKDAIEQRGRSRLINNLNDNLDYILDYCNDETNIKKERDDNMLLDVINLIRGLR